MDQNDFEKLNGQTLLVFGGAGFIGTNFIRRVIKEAPECRIVNFDKLTYSGNRANLEDVSDKFISYYPADIVDAEMVEAVFQNEEPDYVINFAAETHVDRSIHVGSKEFIDTNVTGVYNILEACKKYGVTKYVQVSTDEVYGQLPSPHDAYKLSSRAEGPTVEELAIVSAQKFRRGSPFKPNVPYSATKAAGDCLCNAYHHTWNVPVVVTHCSNNYGPYQYPEKLVPFWALRVIAGEPIPMYGDGLNVRDWIHVDDHVTALGAALLRGVPGMDYLIGADNERTNLEMAKLITHLLDPGAVPNVQFVADRPGHDRRYAIDHSAITEELGWTPKYGPDAFVVKMQETLEWYRDHVEWAQEIVKRTGVSNPHIDLWRGTMEEKDL